jgi:hypothetical protein
MDLREIEKRLEQALLKATGWLPEGELRDMLSLVRAGEPGVALENFCTQLEENDIAVPRELAAELRELACEMGIRASRWIENAADA